MSEDSKRDPDLDDDDDDDDAPESHDEAGFDDPEDAE